MRTEEWIPYRRLQPSDDEFKLRNSQVCGKLFALASLRADIYKLEVMWGLKCAIHPVVPENWNVTLYIKNLNVKCKKY